MNGPIDIVIPWVSGTDPEWLTQKKHYANAGNYPSEGTKDYRFESWDNLHLLFRAIERFMPWYHKIFLVTCGEVPDFLWREHKRLRLVSHADYIPAEYLPTFNTNTIELNLHRIADLSENFVLFNDDLFPLQDTPEEYYFRDNVPCDEAIESVIVPHGGPTDKLYYNAMFANNIRIVNRHFNKGEIVRKNHEKWFHAGYGEDNLLRNKNLQYWHHFTGFRNPHMAAPYQKSCFQTLWEQEPEMLDTASRNKFRNYTDVSDYAVRYWNLCTGHFIPRKTQGRQFAVTMDNYHEAVQLIRTQTTPMISISEVCTPEEFPVIKQAINQALLEILPEKCSFEK